MSRRKGTAVEPKDETEITEIVKADIARVDGVLGPANGVAPLLMKSLPDDGTATAALELLQKTSKKKGSTSDGEDGEAGDKSKAPPRTPAAREVGDQVDGPDAETPGRAPVTKDVAVPRPKDPPTPPSGADMPDDPDAPEKPAVAMDVTKAELSSADQNDLPDEAFAHIEAGGKKDESGKTTPRSLRHFPVHDAAHTRNALARASESPFGEKAMPKIRAAAKKFGVEVSKAIGDDHPGSPAWEAQDAALLRTAAGQLADLRSRVATSRDREAAEGESYDWDNASDLDCAVQAIECALSIVARLAFTEAVESYAPDAMQKAGRRLSAQSLKAIQAARDHLTELLGQDDPLTAEDGGTDVTKAELDAVVGRIEAVAKGQEKLTKAILGKKKVKKAVSGLGAPTSGPPGTLQAGSGGVPQQRPEPAGADLSAGFGSTASVTAQQGAALPGQEVGQTGGPGVPATVTVPEGNRSDDDPTVDQPEPSGADLQPALSVIESDVARQKRTQGAPYGPPPGTPSDIDGMRKAQAEMVEALRKSVLEPVMKSVQEAVKPLEEGLEAVRKQVKQMADTPLPGGPLLRDAARAQQDYLLVSRGNQNPSQAAPMSGSPEDLRKALETVTDPAARDQLGRALALQASPLLQR